MVLFKIWAIREHYWLDISSATIAWFLAVLRYKEMTMFWTTRSRISPKEYSNFYMRINYFIPVILRHCYWMTKPYSTTICLVCFVPTCEFKFYTNSTISTEYKSVYGQMYKFCISETVLYLIVVRIRARKFNEKWDIGIDRHKNKSDYLHFSL